MTHDAVDPLRLDISADSPRRVIRVSVFGDVDDATVPNLRAVLQEVSARKPDHLEIDLGGTTFFSRAGLMEVVAVGQNMADGFTLITANPAVLRLINILGVACDAGAIVTSGDCGGGPRKA